MSRAFYGRIRPRMPLLQAIRQDGKTKSKRIGPAPISFANIRILPYVVEKGPVYGESRALLAAIPMDIHQEKLVVSAGRITE
ncbi:hypothetical protein SAMN04488056_102439 [Cohaesibacter marisflavi]|uniref:Uncharacterized protein n=1 Tax=Cohaesibacter marisflavi TaxID=655353 RepID=A0A1I5D1U0_9HYPH|nr:hypothetical protein SAMN04488056_102439 [Cohaesibacter marisflavi]